jgi:hypothetical protein
MCGGPGYSLMCNDVAWRSMGMGRAASCVVPVAFAPRFFQHFYLDDPMTQADSKLGRSIVVRWRMLA